MNSRGANAIPEAPLENAKKKRTGTSFVPDTLPKGKTDAANASRPLVENHPNREATPNPGVRQPNPKKVKNTSPRSQKRVQKVDAIASDTRAANQETEPIGAKPADPEKPVPKKTAAKRPPEDKPATGFGKTGETIQNDIKTPSSEQPDPADVIKWLLQEKEKSKPNIPTCHERLSKTKMQRIRAMIEPATGSQFYYRYYFISTLGLPASR